MIPHWAPPTHAMQIWRYAEQGSIELLWISATNPAVSLPDLARIRRILGARSCMVVVQDLFLTETAELADVVLPGATWGEKTGAFTNADRTVHLSERAVDPPGEARADLDIFLDYARRMDFRDRDGAPLIKWHDAEGAFEAWKACSKGRPCDYSALSYDAAARRPGSSGRAPSAPTAPSGSTPTASSTPIPTSPRPTARISCTGAPASEEEYRAKQPRGPRLPARRRLPPVARGARATSTRCCSRPGARSTTSTRARRPAARRSCRPPRPDVWVELHARRRRARSGSPRATASASARRAARSRARRG